MINFEFLEKGLGIDYPSYFVYNFSRKMFLMLYSTNWPNFIFWFAIVSFPGCDVKNFEINLICLIKPFPTWLKSQDKNLYV